MTLFCSQCKNRVVSNSGVRSKNGVCNVCLRAAVALSESNRTKGIGIHPVLARKYETVLQEFPHHAPIRDYAESKAEFEEKLPVISGYQITECIGQGAMGRVYYAREHKSGREIAIKVLSPEFFARADLSARFAREVAVLKTLRHPNVVAIIDSGITKDLHYFCMEYIRGTTLRRCLVNGAIKPEMAIQYIYSLLQGLGAMHSKGIVHRDVKPENILLQFDGAITSINGSERVVLVDFGLAGIHEQASDKHANLTRSRVTMGTVNYMAPEQHVDAKRVDHRADIYACGVILYECLTGTLPLGRFALPSEKVLRAGEMFDNCVVKALALDREDRFQTAQDFCDALTEISKALADPQVQVTLPEDTTKKIIQSRAPYVPKKMTKRFKSTYKNNNKQTKKIVIGVIALILAIFVCFKLL